MASIDMERLAQGEGGSKTEMYKKLVKALYVGDDNDNSSSTRLVRLEGHPLPYLPLFPVDYDEELNLEDPGRIIPESSVGERHNLTFDNAQSDI